MITIIFQINNDNEVLALSLSVVQFCKEGVELIGRNNPNIYEKTDFRSKSLISFYVQSC